MSQNLTDFPFPRFLSPWKHALGLPNVRRAGTTVSKSARQFEKGSALSRRLTNSPLGGYACVARE